MRLAVLVASNPAQSADATARIDAGALSHDDGRIRAALEELSFAVVTVDDEGDLAGALARAVDCVDPGDTLVVHVSGRLAEDVRVRVGERTLALRDVSRVSARAGASVLVIVDVVHDGDADDTLLAIDHAERVREALDAHALGIAALVAVNAASPRGEALAFTRLALRLAREAGARGASLSGVVDRLRAMPESHTAAQSYVFVDGAREIDLAPAQQAAPSSDLPDRDALLGLADGARDRQAWDHAVAGYRAALLLPSLAAATRATLHARIGAVERSRGRAADAQRAFEKALDASPRDRTSLDALITFASGEGDWARFVALSRLRVALVDDPMERVDEHFAIARTLVAERKDLSGAVEELEKARAIEPTRDDVLEALRRAYKKLGRWSNLIEIVGVLADIAPTSTERAARRFSQARVALDQLGNHELGIAFLEAALEDDPTHDEALEVLAATRTARGELATFERSLKRLVERFEDLEDEDRARDALRRLVALRPDTPLNETIDLPSDLLADADADAPPETPAAAEMRDLDVHVEISPTEAPTSDIFGIETPIGPIPAAALYRSMERSAEERAEAVTPVGEMLAADPSPPSMPFEALDLGTHAIVAEQLAAQGNEEGAVVELEAAVAKAPLHAPNYARLFALHTRADRMDRAFLAALALEELDALGPEHAALLDASRTDAPLRVRALLDATAWDILRAPGSDDVIDALLGAIARPAIAAHLDDPRVRRKLRMLDPSRKQDATSTASVVRSFHWAARILGVTCPDLYVLDEVPGDIAAVPALEPATALGPGVVRDVTTKDLAFVAGRHLTYYRAEHSVLVHFQTLSEITVLVLAAVQLALPGIPIPPAVAQQVATLRVRLSRHLREPERTAMTAAVQRLDARGGRVDIAGWIRSIELTAGRAGLLLSGDLRTAMTRLRAERRSIAGITLRDVRADLLAFCASSAHADLRSEFATVASQRPPPQSSGVMSREGFGSSNEWAHVRLNKAEGESSTR